MMSNRSSKPSGGPASRPQSHVVPNVRRKAHPITSAGSAIPTHVATLLTDFYRHDAAKMGVTNGKSEELLEVLVCACPETVNFLLPKKKLKCYAAV
jgi:hypothetical protein